MKWIHHLIFLIGNLGIGSVNLAFADDLANQKMLISLPLKEHKALLQSGYGQNWQVKSFVEEKNISLLEIPAHDLTALSHFMHENFHRCGGFFVETNEEEVTHPATFEEQTFVYEVRHQEIVVPTLRQVEEPKIRQTIQELSNFQNRYYLSETGVKSQERIAEIWRTLTAQRADAKIEFETHNGYPQKSVILTFTGTTTPDEVVVIGGHGDSIAGWYPPNDVRAPGADDNASGIATITEIIRVLMKENFSFGRTIKFISYAAEEVGLRGSQDIARRFRNEEVKVAAVMQLDMTNYRGSPYDIVFMSDYTNPELTTFFQELARVYLPQAVTTTDRCGYACSDHASWTKFNFPSAIPFESRMRDYNSNIHTAQDTISVSQNTANHAVNFAKIGLAFALELTASR